MMMKMKMRTLSGKRKTAFTALLAIALLAVGANSAFAATVWESEPNNTAATADAVSFGDTGKGYLNGPGGGADNDYWAFTATSTGTAHVTFSSDGQTSEVVNQYVYVPGGASGTITPTSWTTTLTFPMVAGQTYNVVVVKPTGTAASYSYSLRIW